MGITPFDLDSVRVKALPRLTWSDVFTEREGSDGLTADEKSALDDYLSRFTSPKDGCPGCGASLAGTIVDAFVGRVSFVWGLVNGEGYCQRCGYPARAYHRDIGPVEFFNAVLPYHPDELTAGDSAQGEDSAVEAG